MMTTQRFNSASDAERVLLANRVRVQGRSISEAEDKGLKVWAAVDYLVNTHKYGLVMIPARVRNQRN